MLIAKGSSLAETCMGVWLTALIALARSAIDLVENSRSRATEAASLPVSFWTFLMCALISVRSFWRCWTIDDSIVRAREACESAMTRVLSRIV